MYCYFHIPRTTFLLQKLRGALIWGEAFIRKTPELLFHSGSYFTGSEQPESVNLQFLGTEKTVFSPIEASLGLIFRDMYLLPIQK